jgi:ATP-dependent Clp endopeptidase proteolytic subunit ClpP
MTKVTKKTKKTKKDKEKEIPPEVEEMEESEEASAADLLTLLAGAAEENPEARSIYFSGDLNEERGAEIITALLVLSKQKNSEGEIDPIKLYVSTYGGAADEMFAIYDVINHIKGQGVVIETIGLGKVMSAGTLLLACGTKGHRRVGAHTRIMIHSVAGGSMGELHSIKNELEQMNILQESYIQAMSNETEMSKKQIQSLINRKVNVYLSAEEAIEKGLADEVY